MDIYPDVFLNEICTVVASDGGMGKSTLLTRIAAHVTRGTPWPNGSPCPQGSVLIVHSGEVDEDRDWRPRLAYAGADNDKVQFHNTYNAGGALDIISDRNRNILEMRIKTQKSILVIADPMLTLIPHLRNERAVDQGLIYMNNLARRLKCCVLMINHLTKRKDIVGSYKLLATARCLYQVRSIKKRDRILYPYKTNSTARDKALRFRIERRMYNGLPVPYAVIHSKWYAVSEYEQYGKKMIVEAMDWLEELLAEGPKDILDIKDEGKPLGFDWPTIKAARLQLGIERVGNKWRLAEDDYEGWG